MLSPSDGSIILPHSVGGAYGKLWGGKMYGYIEKPCFRGVSPQALPRSVGGAIGRFGGGRISLSDCFVQLLMFSLGLMMPELKLFSFGKSTTLYSVGVAIGKSGGGNTNLLFGPLMTTLAEGGAIGRSAFGILAPNDYSETRSEGEATGRFGSGGYDKST